MAVTGILNAIGPVYNATEADANVSPNGFFDVVGAGCSIAYETLADGRRWCRVTTPADTTLAAARIYKHTGGVTITSQTSFGVATFYFAGFFQFGASYAAEEIFIRGRGVAATTFTIRRDSTNHIKAYNTNGTLLGTSTLTIAEGTPFRMEFKLTAGSSTGELTIQLYTTNPDTSTSPDETMSYTSINTSANNTDYLYIGKATNTNAAATNVAFRDVIIATGDWIGPKWAIGCFPSADGDQADFTGGTAGNWDDLNGDPPGVAAYLLSTNTTDQGETPKCLLDFGGNAVNGYTGTFFGVKMQASVRRDGASNGSLALSYRSAASGTTYESTASVTDSIIKYVGNCFLDSDVGTPTLATVMAGQQCGVREKDVTNKSRVYSVLAIVLFTPSTSPPGQVTGLTATGVETIALDWDDVSGASSYTDEYTLDGGANWSVLHSGLATSDDTDTITPGTYIGYRAYAVNANGNGAYSSEVYLNLPMTGGSSHRILLLD